MKVLEQGKRLSQSSIWEAQRVYFDEMGVHAWNGQVPFFVTSNPFVAQNTAELMANAIADLKHAGKLDLTQPVYVLELGTGSGQFSYYCLRYLLKLANILKLTDVKIIYVMSDFTRENVQFWENHALFKPYVEQGVLDFAPFDMERSKSLELLVAGRTLDKGSMQNPLLCIANYIFDTVYHDVFRAEGGRLFESLLTLEADESNIVDHRPKKLENLNSHFEQQPVGRNYYQHDILDRILDAYPNQLSAASFLFPTGTFKALDVLKSLCHDQLIIVSTDKGYCHLHEIEGRGDPQIAFHGSLSMSVNFHAITQYFKLQGGDALMQTPREGIKTNLFIMGDVLDNFPLLHQAANRFVEGFSAADFFTFHRHFRETDEFKIHTILSHLHFGRWDPYVFSIFSQKIMTELPNAPANISEGFIQGVDQLLENIYPMPGAEDHYLNIGVMLHSLHHYERALEVYEQSRVHYGDKFHNTFNMGLCLYMLEEYNHALGYFKLACGFEDAPEVERARDWYSDCERQCQTQP